MASQSASDSATTGVGSTSALGIREIIQTTRNNEIWKDFNMCIMTNGQKKAQCKHCFNFLSVGSNTTLKHHISHPHCEVLKAQQNQNPEAGQTSMGRDGQIFMFNPDYLREQFAGLVIQRGLPFNHFDHEQTTRVFQNTMQPRYTHVSRSTLKRTNQTQSNKWWGSLSGGDSVILMLHLLQCLIHILKKDMSRGDPTMSSEYEQYLKTDFVSGLQPKDFASYDVLGFWKSKENQFPVLSRMAMDILSVQASSVASESAFSTSGRSCSVNKNNSPLKLPLDVEEGVFNDEVQQNEATQLTDQEIALDASSDGSLSSGERRRDYMMSSGAEDDQTGEGGSMSHGYTYY
ncbi:zinc finger BED domain-containing protein RICESLEEPER 2-like protein [Tanacetum coccineum]|uniref:Zinc finger BED domain-containing protein RICESLEEPER 2-like protein n=1 Tax=Tanacetum coccineum TaxID=301880 RepID=A0ABQ4X4M2_9ASTR